MGRVEHIPTPPRQIAVRHLCIWWDGRWSCGCGFSTTNDEDARRHYNEYPRGYYPEGSADADTI